MFVEILVVSLIWLVAFVAMGFAVLPWAIHQPGALMGVALMYAAIGAAGEATYLMAESMGWRPRLPRWFLVGAWTLGVSITIGTAAMAASAPRGIGIIEMATMAIMLLAMMIFPVFITAYIASWPFRHRRSKRVTTSKLKDYYEGKDYYGIWD